MKLKYVLLIFIIAPFVSAFSQRLRLENENLLAVFDSADGSLIQLVNKETGWNIVNRHQLGQSFEMLVPMEERRYHLVGGKGQRAPEIQATENSIQFTWKALKSKYIESDLNITFKGTVTLTDEGLIYSGEIFNNDEFPIEYIAWPFLGELTAPNLQKQFVCQGRNGLKELFPRFHSEHGYWGVEYPTNLSLLPENAFLLIRDDTQGIYIFSEQATPSEMLIASFELIPGFDLPGMNPVTDEVDGQPARIQFKANHVVYAQPWKTARLEPVKIAPYSGDWQKGADMYKKWKQDLTSATPSADWIGQPLNWQKVSITSGADLIAYAKEAQESGVSVLLVGGWMKMNGKAPVSIVDNLSKALVECKKLNVKVVLETSLNSADFRSSWYKNVLNDEVMTDPYGWPYDPRILCPEDKRLQGLLEEEYSHHPEILSADGIICDDNNHRGKSFFCFNPNHNHEIPAFADHGIFEMDKHFADLVRQSGSQTVTLGYGFYDTQTLYYDGYFIDNAAKEQSLQRYVNPATPIIASMDVRTARRDINLCLKNRYTICYDLRFYSDRLKTYPQIMEYGKQIESFRNRYKEFIWDGAFSDVIGASVAGNHLSYAVFTRKSDGKKAVVVVNRSETEIVTAQVSIDDSHALAMAFPEDPQAVDCDGNMEIQPLSVVIVMEK